MGQYRVSIRGLGSVVLQSCASGSFPVKNSTGVYRAGVFCPQFVQQLVNLRVRRIIKGRFSAVIVVADYFCFRQLL